LGGVALYALSTLFAAALTPAHGERSGIMAQASSAQLCAAGHADKSRTADDCCDICVVSAAAGLEPPPSAHFVIRPEIATRLNFALRLGRVADATPDNLRSRAPPAPLV
jgi:hypothetical protein